MKSISIFHRRFQLTHLCVSTFLVAAAGALGLSTVQGATDYFDPTDTTTLGGSGTFAAQSTALYSSTSAGGGTLIAAATGDTGIFQGTAGTVTFSATPYALASAQFNTTGYTLTPSSTTAIVFNTPIVLAAGVNLGLDDPAATTNRTLGVGSISGGAGSGLTIQGAQVLSGTTVEAARLNIAVASSTISVPITISATGSNSVAGVVAITAGAILSSAATITNNSTALTNLGATGSSVLTVNGIVSGSAGVLFAAGASGGAGVVTVNSLNTYTGATTFNNSANGIIRIGVANALPTTTALQFGLLAQGAGVFDLNGLSQQVASITTPGTGAVAGISNTSSTAASLIISGSATTTYASTIGVPTATTTVTGTNNNISLTLAATNTGNLTLTGANAYTGATTISGGTLTLANTTTTSTALSATTQVNVNGGGTLAMGAANQLTATTPVQFAGTGSKAATFTVGGFSQGSTSAAGIGMLTLTAASSNNVINFGNAAAVVSFASLTANSAILTINGYINNNGASGGSDELLFATAPSATDVSNIIFTGYGAAQEQQVSTGFYEVFPAPVPEPSTVFYCLLAGGVAAGWQRRRQVRAWMILHRGA